VGARLRQPAAPDAAIAEAVPGPARAQGADPSAPSPAPPTDAPLAPLAAAAKQTLRVDFEKLDLLMNLVGELVLSKAGLATGIHGLSSLGRELRTEQRNARRALGADGRKSAEEAARRALSSLGDELGRVERVFHEVAHDLDSSSGRLDRVSSDLRDQVMKLRMVPIAGVFRKYHRTVRDLAHALGKKVRLELQGEDTELDKLLVEQLDDPLMHLVRNAVDHGIEAPDARAAAGKPVEGVLRLSARHRGNQIVLTLSDDGGGIDPERMRRKAREKELLGDDELDAMEDRAALELIFRPGFSTAQRITDVSGRGVGMDVVREAIVTRLKGAIDVSSQVGRGTTFTLRLPLTLAIIQVLLARAGGETFCIPLDQVTRTLTCAPSDVHPVYDREVLAVGDRQVPIVRLRHALELETHDDRSGAELHVILVEVLGSLYGLACERLLGKQEIVIKSLGDVLQDVPCAAGATLLGDRCAIILDVPAVVQRALAQDGGAARGSAARGSAARGSAAGGGREGSERPEAAPHQDAEPRARILLVEDSDTVREALRRLLEGAGYAVTEARDGREGLALARSAHFDLISTDVTMPHMDGYELCRALRADARHRATPIIMVTTRGEKIDRVRGFDAGVDEYITKPHDRQDLLRAVAKHLEREGA
jgi:two-component system chemotaxis sensor kinase CheA